jgi:tetratricopeptide (TPR) repeat protein
LLAITLAAASGERFSPEAHGATRIRDLHLQEAGDRVRLVLLLDALPSYTLSSPVPQKIEVTLLDTTAVEGIGTRVPSVDRPAVQIGQDGANVHLQMALEVPIREVCGTWLPGENVLHIEFVRDLFTKSEPSSGPSEVRLKHVRFGQTNGCVRIVTEYDARPRWEWSILKGRRLTLRLREAQADIRPGPLAALRGVSDARLKKTEGGTRLEVTLSRAASRAKIFWLEPGNRLVADLGDGGSNPDAKALGLPEDFGRRIPSAGTKEPAVSPPAISSEGGASSETTERTSPEEGHSEASAVVRMRVPEAPSPGSGKAPIEAQAAPLPATKTTEGAGKPTTSKIDPRDLRPDEALLYGRILESRNFRDYERGSALIAEFAARFPESPLIESLSFLKGDLEFALIESGREELLSQMEATYRAAIERFPDSQEAPRAYLRLSEGQRLAGNDYQAIGYLTTLINRYPRSELVAQAYLQRGHVYVHGLFPEKALEDYKGVLKAYPESPLAHEARYGIIAYLHKKKLYEEAEKWMIEMDQMRPDFYRQHPEYLSLRAQNHLYLKAYPEARRLFLLAINTSAQPETRDLILARIGDTYLYEGKEKEAQRVYRAVVEDFPKTEGAGIAQLRLADFNSGTQTIEEVGEQHKNRPIGELAQLKMANIHVENGHYAEAMESLKGLVATPGDPALQTPAKQLYYDAAKRELMRLHGEGRLEAFVELLGANEPLLSSMIEPELRLLQGQTLQRLGKTAEAAQAFEKIRGTDLTPKDRGPYYFHLAETYRALEESDKAMRVAEEGRSGQVEEQARSRITLLLAELRMASGDLDAARSLFQELIEGRRLLSAPGLARSYYQLGRILRREGHSEKAEEALHLALAAIEKDREQRSLYSLIQGELGDCHFFQGRPAEASKAYQEALIAGYDPEAKGYWGIKFRLAECHLRLGEMQSAEGILRQVVEEGDPEFQGRAQIRLGALQLERELRRLSIREKGGLAKSAHVKP